MTFENEDWLNAKDNSVEWSWPVKEGDGVYFIREEDRPEKLTRTETVYTIIGKEEYLEKDKYPCLHLKAVEATTHKNAYAIKISIGNRTKYYVKRGNDGRIFNPIGMFSEGTSTKQVKHAGKGVWNFKEIKEDVFDLYINFLLTKNVSYLRNAERELL